MRLTCQIGEAENSLLVLVYITKNNKQFDFMKKNNKVKSLNFLLNLFIFK